MKVLFFLSALLIAPMMFSCAFLNQSDMDSYKVYKITEPIPVNSDWNKKPWTALRSISLENFMGARPDHIPKVQSKVAYDEHNIYVIFKVEDRFVRAIRKNHQDDVYKDSCVEFFFSPEDHSANGYFNLEMNCGGTMLFHHQKEPRKNSTHISEQDIAQIEVAHSLPTVVDPEITTPTTWTVEYRIPFSVLKKYHNLESPNKGSVWRGNFYKCADETSHPHWLTWALIDRPKPDFHVPEYFGKLIFN